MVELALAIGAISLATFWAAWHEYAHGQRSDARLLGAFGLAGALASGTAWLI